MSWINWFVNQQANEFVCRVPCEYMRNKKNLEGLETMVPNFERTLYAILDPKFDDGFGAIEMPETAQQLYGLIHARYILSRRGIVDMCFKYQRGDFGNCPRNFCDGQSVLPMGLSYTMGESQVKIYCPRCQDIYQPNACYAPLDGAMFGCSFPHIFFMYLPYLLPKAPIEKYTPCIYGFKLHKSAQLPFGSDYSNENLPDKEQAKPLQFNRG